MRYEKGMHGFLIFFHQNKHLLNSILCELIETSPPHRYTVWLKIKLSLVGADTTRMQREASRGLIVPVHDPVLFEHLRL